VLSFEKEYKRAVNFSDFVSSIPINKIFFKSNYDDFVPDKKTINFFKSINGLKIMVIGECWCKDTINELPILAKLADLCGIGLRILTRDDNLDLVDGYFLTDGKRRMPVVIFLDSNYAEVARWIERPRKIDDVLHSGAESIRSMGIDTYKQLIKFETMREIIDILRYKMETQE